MENTAPFVFKGMTCFQGGHYLNFFRRIVQPKLPMNEVDRVLWRQEITSTPEWTCQDDHLLESVGLWEQVVYKCIDLRIYPTCLYFEQIPLYSQDSSVNLHPDKCALLLKRAQQSDENHCFFGDGFSA